MYNYLPESQKPLIQVNKASNGWMVTVYHINRDKETSPETLEEIRKKKKKEEQERIEREQERIAQDLLAQFTSAALLGELATKAQTKSLEESFEPWKDSENLSEEEILEKVTPIAKKLAQESVLNRHPFNRVQKTLETAVETHVFTDRQEMTDFVSKMLCPIIE